MTAEWARRRPLGPAPLRTIRTIRDFFLCFYERGRRTVLFRSGFADRLENRGGERVGGRLAGPHDVLKGGVEAFAFADRDLDQVVQLLGHEARGAAQWDSVAEHRQA